MIPEDENSFSLTPQPVWNELKLRGVGQYNNVMLKWMEEGHYDMPNKKVFSWIVIGSLIVDH